MSSEKNLKDKKKKRKIGSNFCYDVLKWFGIWPALIWLRPKRIFPHGKKRVKGGVLVCANHRSFLDPLIVHCAILGRRLNCLATKDLYDTKKKARFFNLMNCIMVDKENFSLSSFHTVVEKLQDKKVVVIFPEGQVNREETGGVLAFKSGAVFMAHKSGAPILPMYIVKREKWYERQKIVIGEPFDVRDALGAIPTLEKLTTVSEQLRIKEVELSEYYEAHFPKSKKKVAARGEENKENKEKELV